MNKDAYKDIFQGWVAKAAEYKMAISIAAACTVIVLVSLVWPKPKPEPAINGIATTPPASHPVTPSPAASPPPPKPAAEAPAAPAAPTESPMQKELAAKPLFPPPPTPQPAPAQSAPAPKPRSMPAPISKAAPQPVPAGYYVQVGSFKDRQHAVALAAKVEDKHWQSRLAARPGGLHAVWVGPYPTRAAVDKAKADLKRDTGLSGFVVKAP